MPPWRPRTPPWKPQPQPPFLRADGDPRVRGDPEHEGQREVATAFVIRPEGHRDGHAVAGGRPTSIMSYPTPNRATIRSVPRRREHPLRVGLPPARVPNTPVEARRSARTPCSAGRGVRATSKPARSSRRGRSLPRGQVVDGHEDLRRAGHSQFPVLRPPSTLMIWPVMYSRPASCGRPRRHRILHVAAPRPIGIREMLRRIHSASLNRLLAERRPERVPARSR